MDLDSALATVLIASGVSIASTLITVRTTSRVTLDTSRQTQFQEIIKKRIEFYPKLWKIHISYETDWTLARKTKTREWAIEYLDRLAEFNREGGIFFSQAAYVKFFELRHVLHHAVDETAPGQEISPELAFRIRDAVYGSRLSGPGMSSHLKDDLGSYRAAELQNLRPRPSRRRRLLNRVQQLISRQPRG